MKTVSLTQKLKLVLQDAHNSRHKEARALILYKKAQSIIGEIIAELRTRPTHYRCKCGNYRFMGSLGSCVCGRVQCGHVNTVLDIRGSRSFADEVDDDIQEMVLCLDCGTNVIDF